MSQVDSGSVLLCTRACLIEADWRGIEAVLVGWFTGGDPDYMRLARLGVHSFMASHMLGRPADLQWSDSDLSLAFKEIKHTERKVYDDAKHTVHGTNYGMGPRLMSDMLPRCPRRRRSGCRRFTLTCFQMRQWQRATLDRAAKECKLRNPFGYEMSFWEVQQWDRKQAWWTLGEDAKSAIAFLPRDTARRDAEGGRLCLRPLAEERLIASTI